MVSEDFGPAGQYIHTTDVIISQYENVLSKKISSKILSSQKTGKPAFFTDEETAYLNKKSVDDANGSTLDIETSAPDLTLKKGETEIKIKHAAELFKKMEQKFPKGVSKDNKEDMIKQQPYTTDENNFQSSTIQIVNKNAYEIRELILEQAIDIVKFSSYRDVSIDLMTDKVLEIANKFYDFVENKHRKY